MITKGKRAKYRRAKSINRKKRIRIVGSSRVNLFTPVEKPDDGQTKPPFPTTKKNR